MTVEREVDAWARQTGRFGNRIAELESFAIDRAALMKHADARLSFHGSSHTSCSKHRGASVPSCSDRSIEASILFASRRTRTFPHEHRQSSLPRSWPPPVSERVQSPQRGLHPRPRRPAMMRERSGADSSGDGGTVTPSDGWVDQRQPERRGGVPRHDERGAELLGRVSERVSGRGHVLQVGSRRQHRHVSRQRRSERQRPRLPGRCGPLRQRRGGERLQR